MKTGFDSQKYLLGTIAYIAAVNNYDSSTSSLGKLYDKHATRVLPGFDEKVKNRSPQIAQGINLEVLICIFSGDIERQKSAAIPTLLTIWKCYASSMICGAIIWRLQRGVHALFRTSGYQPFYQQAGKAQHQVYKHAATKDYPAAIETRQRKLWQNLTSLLSSPLWWSPDLAGQRQDGNLPFTDVSRVPSGASWAIQV